MQVLLRVLMLGFFITGLALSAGSVSAQQFSPRLPPDLMPQWTPIPGAPGVQHAPNTNTDLFRYGQRYYYQQDGKWYQGRNLAGPWQRVQKVPQSFRQIQANYFRQPPEWAAPRLPFSPDLTPQWTPIPGAPGVHYAPNANTDLFRYGQRYYYQQDGKWYQGRNLAGPWQRVKDVPQSFRRIEAPYFKQPPEWAAPRLPFSTDLTPQWTPIPGAPGVHYAPNANTDLFRYDQRYYYQHDGKWYQGRNLRGPWQRVKDVPQSFRRIEAPYFKQPPGWAKGKKTGWGEAPMPPGQMKHQEGGQHMPPGQMKKHDR